MYVRDDVPEPEPGFGQVLAQVKACGICGSDLHFAKHGPQMMALTKEIEGMPDMGMGGLDIDFDRDVYMGHEFAAEVLDVGTRHRCPRSRARSSRRSRSCCR